MREFHGRTVEGADFGLFSPPRIDNGTSFSDCYEFFYGHGHADVNEYSYGIDGAYLVSSISAGHKLLGSAAQWMAPSFCFYRLVRAEQEAYTTVYIGFYFFAITTPHLSSRPYVRAEKNACKNNAGL